MNNNRNNVNKKNNNSIKKNNLLSKTYFKSGIFFLTILFLLLSFIIFNYDDLYKMLDDNSKTLVESEIKFTPSYEEKMTIGQFLGTRQNLINTGEGLGISIQWDMNIPNTMGNKGWTSNYNNLKPILLFGDSPLIYFHPKLNQLFVNIKYRIHEQYFEYEQIKIDVKLQRWNNYLVTFNNRNVNIYVNNKLENSKTLNNVPIISTESNKFVQIGEKNNNMIGKINNLVIYFRYINPKEVLNL